MASGVCLMLSPMAVLSMMVLRQLDKYSLITLLAGLACDGLIFILPSLPVILIGAVVVRLGLGCVNGDAEGTLATGIVAMLVGLPGTLYVGMFTLASFVGPPSREHFSWAYQAGSIMGLAVMVTALIGGVLLVWNHRAYRRWKTAN